MASYVALFPSKSTPPPMTPDLPYDSGKVEDHMQGSPPQHYTRPSYDNAANGGTFWPGESKKSKLSKVKTIATLAIFPVTSFVYITFCLVVHYKHVFINVTHTSQLGEQHTGL